jgi:hypothetical protein
MPPIPKEKKDTRLGVLSYCYFFTHFFLENLIKSINNRMRRWSIGLLLPGINIRIPPSKIAACRLQNLVVFMGIYPSLFF